jgi:hypothetical protein
MSFSATVSLSCKPPKLISCIFSTFLWCGVLRSLDIGIPEAEVWRDEGGVDKDGEDRECEEYEVGDVVVVVAAVV